MKISAVFSDYDGTLAPENVPLESSDLPKEIQASLEMLSSKVPIAMVTSKDFAFIRPRTPFASAWACVSGLEIVLPGGRVLPTERVSRRIREGLEYVRRHDNLGLSLEPKRNTKGELLAFSIDWRGASSPPTEFIETATAELARMGLTVVQDPAEPFIDVFGALPDKGRAVKELKRHLNLGGNVLFIGDSKSDNSAFEESEVSIGVDHGQTMKSLSCRFVLHRDKLGAFFQTLAEDGLSIDLRALARR